MEDGTKRERRGDKEQRPRLMYSTRRDLMHLEVFVVQVSVNMAEASEYVLIARERREKQGLQHDTVMWLGRGAFHVTLS
jgi:hypothetical protein